MIKRQQKQQKKLHKQSSCLCSILKKELDLVTKDHLAFLLFECLRFAILLDSCDKGFVHVIFPLF